MQGNRVFNRLVIEVPASSPCADKLYKALISLDAQFCLQKIDGSITLHYAKGNLVKIHEQKYIHG